MTQNTPPTTRSAGFSDCMLSLVPTAYRDGYLKARELDARLADDYIRNTMVGDPPADRVIDELAPVVGTGREHVIINRALSNHENMPEGTPGSLRDLVTQASTVPDWYDEEIAFVATRAFLRNPELFLAGLATGSIVEGFSCLISKSFRIRGRILDNGVRRLQQNNLQLFEQFMPAGLQPGSDGWKLTMRIRLVHAQARKLIKASSEWDEHAFGIPLSASHMLLGAASFSGRLMRHLRLLGAGLSREECEAYVHVWRHAGILLGIPEEVIFNDLQSANRIFEIGATCEPVPDYDAIIMANSIINCIPIVLGETSSSLRKRHVSMYYQISRELIGNELADKLKFPPSRRVPTLPFIAAKHTIIRWLEKYASKGFLAKYHRQCFEVLLKSSDIGLYHHSYLLPSELEDERSKKW